MKYIREFACIVKSGFLLPLIFIAVSFLMTGNAFSQTDFKIRAGCDLCLNGKEL